MSGEDLARKRTNLGRGLDALFGEDDDYGPVDRGRPSRLISIDLLEPNPYQPRRVFDEEAMASLVESVREQGVLQPILVRPLPDRRDRYQIVAGERRWRASQQVGLHEVPVVIRDLTDLEALQIAIVENVQRSDLSPVEEAEGYRRLIREFDYTQEDLARAVGKSRSHIANTLRLLDLPDPVRGMLEAGNLTAGHARALLTCPDPVEAARTVVERGLSVRQTEELARGGAAPQRRSRAGGTTAAAKPAKDADTAALEQEMSSLLGLRVTINPGAGQSGTLTIHYQALDQLDHVLHRLSQGRRG